MDPRSPVEGIMVAKICLEQRPCKAQSRAGCRVLHSSCPEALQLQQHQHFYAQRVPQHCDGYLLQTCSSLDTYQTAGGLHGGDKAVSALLLAYLQQALSLESALLSLSIYTFTNSATVLLVGRGILSVEAEGQGSHFLFATMHLESPIGPKSPLKTFFEEQRRTQAEQVWLLIACAE